MPEHEQGEGQIACRWRRLAQAPDTHAGWRAASAAQLLELLREATRRGLLDADAIAMLEGVLAVADLQVRDIMVPRAADGVRPPR